MSPTFTVTSQKVKVYLLSSSNYRSKIWQISKPSTEHCPSGVTTVELALNDFFMQLLQFSAYKVFILFFGHILRQVLVQKFKQLQEKMVPVE